MDFFVLYVDISFRKKYFRRYLLSKYIRLITKSLSTSLKLTKADNLQFLATRKKGITIKKSTETISNIYVTNSTKNKLTV